MKATVVSNASAGSIAASEASATVSRVREAFARTSVEAEILSISHESSPAAARRAAASDADVVVLGGGDGTLGTGAAALLGSHKPLGILPFGSLNHFAKDVGIPLDLDQAVGTIERGYVTEVDVGEVNGRIFLNNSSIGLYPSFIFVGNNRYEMSLFSLGTRRLRSWGGPPRLSRRSRPAESIWCSPGTSTAATPATYARITSTSGGGSWWPKPETRSRIACGTRPTATTSFSFPRSGSPSPSGYGTAGASMRPASSNT